MGQRISRPLFSQATGGLNVTAPSNPNLTPPGYYMLFILNSNGVPSLANIVAIYSTTPPPTPTPPPAPPEAPSNLTATAVGCQEIDLSWTDNSNNEGGFKIERGTNATSLTQIATVGPNVTSYQNNLSGGGLRYYRVRAYNAGGDSAYSNTASATAPT